MSTVRLGAPFANGTPSISAAHAYSIDGAIAGRIGIQKLEIGLHASFTERYSQLTSTRPNPWASVGGSVSYAIQPRLVGRFEYIRFHPIGDIGTGSDLKLAVERKQMLHPKIAFDGSGGFTFAAGRRSGEDQNELILQTRSAIQATATPRLSGEIALPLDINLGGGLFDHTLTLGISPAALYAATDHLDIFARIFVGLLPAPSGGSASDFRRYTVGVNWRP